MASKRLKLHPVSLPGVAPQMTDWTLCVLCQQSTSSETLRDPSKSKYANHSSAYETLEENLKALDHLNSLPLSISISRLDDGTGIEATLRSHNAKWHKSCYDMCNKKNIDRVRKRKSKEQCPEANMSPLKCRLRAAFPSTSTETELPVCFFCDNMVEQDYHKVATKNLDTNIRTMATELNDTLLLAKLSSGDMIAMDAIYHKHCLTSFYTRYRSSMRQKKAITGETKLSFESIALAELISYIEEMRETEDSIIKLSDLVHLYKGRLEQLGEDTSQRINATRLKEKLLTQLPDLEAHKSKYEVIMSFKENIGDTLLEATKRNQDDDAVVLMRAAEIIRNEIFQMEYRFKGSLLDEQYDNKSTSLLALVQMILGGTNIEKQTENDREVKSAAISITELLTFNAVKRSRKTSNAVRHNVDRETRLPLYLGLLVHNKTRKRDLIDTLFERGLSVSYDRVLQLSTDIANAVIYQYEDDDVVCPTILKEGLFTTGNLDNLDHNPTSTSAQSAFHGTALSMTQHVTDENAGLERHQNRPLLHEGVEKSKTIKPLMESYCEIPPAALPFDKPTPRSTLGDTTPPSLRLECDETQVSWLREVARLLQKDQVDKDDNISWSAYFAHLQFTVRHPPAISALMPLFRDNAHSVAMVKHGMDVIMKATALVNPAQIPVLTLDQPLYTIAKQIQWTWPSIYSEEKYVVLMGGLHIEMAFLNVLGDWLKGSGWASIMASANVTTEGRADALQSGSHTSRAQWAHQVSAAALFCLQKEAFMAYKDDLEVTAKPFHDWCADMESSHPQFFYWSKTLKLEVLFLQFMRSQRDGNFLMYLEVLGSIIPWMFAMDHFHYARWLSVHVRDLMQLEGECPTVWNEFLKGHFVTQKTSHKFSMMAHDQIHEQLNALVKGDGGIVGITENESALRRWMIAGPEMARIVSEVSVKDPAKNNHHEQSPSTQNRFARNVKSVVDIFNEWGNPFTETSSDLFSIDTNVMMACEVVQNVREAEDLGKAQYKAFVDERMINLTKSIYDTIPKNNLMLFKSGQEKRSSKTKTKISNMKSDLELFSRMYISCQAREGEMDVFFEHENHAWPPSLAENNSMRYGNKADLLKCLEPFAPSPLSPPEVDVKLFDGAALVHTLEPKNAAFAIKTFKDYADRVFLPYLFKHLQIVQRIDVVWDSYNADSLKAHMRECRGTGNQLRVSERTRIPQNWKSFLRVDSNKTELFQYLASVIESAVTPDGKIFVTTKGERVKATGTLDISALQPCTQEEADHRIMLHCAHAYQHGMKKIMLHATDTDVLVLAITTASVLEGCEIWLGFGHKKNFRYIAAHTIAAELGDDWCKGLLFMHAFSGCDTVSSFSGIGKKTVWDVWRSLPSLNTLFSCLSHTPEAITDEYMEQIERFVVLLYSRTSQLLTVNAARKQLFSYGNRKLENLPPSRAALHQHVKRASFQAGYIWGQALIASPSLPSPGDWGWQKNVDGKWTPLWTTLSEASKECRELIKCNCKKHCRGNCKCHKANLKCTMLCYCGGQCTEQETQ